MANTILKVKNMHCSSCAAMIRLELEEDNTYDLKSRLIRVQTTHPDQNTGEVELVDATEEEINHAKELINQIGNYQVIE